MAEAQRPQPLTARQRLVSTAAAFDVPVMLAGLLVGLGGVILIIVGKVTDDGGFYDTPYTWDLRTPGIIAIALAVLITPPSWLLVKTVEAWARETPPD